MKNLYLKSSTQPRLLDPEIGSKLRWSLFNSLQRDRLNYRELQHVEFHLLGDEIGVRYRHPEHGEIQLPDIAKNKIQELVPSYIKNFIKKGFTF